MNCPRCNLPRFYGPHGYAGLTCNCGGWTSPISHEIELPSQLKSHIATLESEVAALRAELAQHKASLPTCDKHKPDRGGRSGCVICSGHALSHALSRIDYACGEPNEMECSDYDVHYNEDEVVKRVVALRAERDALAEMKAKLREEVNGMREDAERTAWLRKNWYRALDTIREAVFSCKEKRTVDLDKSVTAAIDLARKESSK